MRNLKTIRKKRGGRDITGQVVVRHKGGEHKRFLRTIDFKRNKLNISGRVVSVEYDPNRTSDIALIQYADGEKRYILKREGLNKGDSIVAGSEVEPKIGNSLPLSSIPLGSVIHNVELTPGKGGQLARSAGTSIILAAKEGKFAHLKLPSGEVRKVDLRAFATIGQLGKIEWKTEFFGKAGRKIRMGIRPTVRGVAMNPRSHPHGGGEGRSGIGLKYPKTYTGRRAVGKTRKKTKYSNKYILKGRKRKS